MSSEAQSAGESREVMIENAIIAHPERLGFPGARAIRRCRVAEPCGLIDLILLPESGPIRLVLIEAKARSSPDSASKVVGQLLMYYAGALMLGSNGLEILRDFATQYPEKAMATTKVSPKALTGGVTPPSKAWEAMYSGTRLTPSEIQLFIGLDGDPHRAFEPTLRALRQHGLNVGYCIVRDGTISVVPSTATAVQSGGTRQPVAQDRSSPERTSITQATKADRETSELPSQHESVVLNRLFVPEEMERIRAGLVPQEMEDKWFIYWTDNSLYFHRSWTGFCIYVVHFVKEGERFRMCRAELNRDPQQYKETSSAKDAEMISYLIDVLLLNRTAAFPGGSANPIAAVVEEWAQVGQAMLGSVRKCSEDPSPTERPS